MALGHNSWVDAKMKDIYEKINHEKSRGLNENHYRVISAALGLLEKYLSLIEVNIKYTPCGRMYRVINKLTHCEEQCVLSAIKEIKDCISEFADFFNLEPLEENINGMILGGSATYWADLCDIEPQKLNSYGQLSKEAADVLKRYIERLKMLLNAINRPLRGKDFF